MTNSDLKQQTIITYNNSAKELAEYFSGISGSRQKFMDKVFMISPKKNPKVLEIGCGDGRDAQYILQKTDSYEGFDLSEKMINLAKKRNLPGKFFVADLEKFCFKRKYDIIFAMSSLLHSDRNVVEGVIKKAKQSLNENGLLAIDLKMATTYYKKVKKDKFGVRTFYYYPFELINKYFKEYYRIVYHRRETIGTTKWLMMIGQK